MSRICYLRVQGVVHCWLSFHSTIYLLWLKYCVLIMALLRANLHFSLSNQEGVAVFSDKSNPCHGCLRGFKPEFIFLEKNFGGQELLQHQGTLENWWSEIGGMKHLPVSCLDYLCVGSYFWRASKLSTSSRHCPVWSWLGLTPAGNSAPQSLSLAPFWGGGGEGQSSKRENLEGEVKTAQWVKQKLHPETEQTEESLPPGHGQGGAPPSRGEQGSITHSGELGR